MNLQKQFKYYKINKILEIKIQKLEQLVTLKDNKIHTLVNKLA